MIVRKPIRIAIAAALALAIGCARYNLGVQTLYPMDVATVYVPMIESESFRPWLGERLTDAIVKRIEQRTPYKVVGEADADSVLMAKILSDSKRVPLQTNQDDQRGVEVSFNVEVSWINRRGTLVREIWTMPMPEELIKLSGEDMAFIEAGHSVATSQQQAIDIIADRIVGMMEQPW